MEAAYLWGQLQQLWQRALVEFKMEPVLITYASLILMAVIPIYFGSKQSLEESEKEGAEKLSKSDAYWFPIIGSCALFGFYLLFAYFSKEYINYLLTAYFAIFGAYSIAKMLVGIGKTVLPEACYMFDFYHVRIERKRDGVLLDTKLTWLHAAMALVSALITGYYVWTKNWIASNVFAESFAMTAIALIQLDTFSTGMILLAGLFVYDIFWVFGTNVMVSVAKSFDVPVKLLFPRDVISSPHSGFSMLGLGDVVIPGTLIAMCLKFDHHLAAQKRIQPGFTPYFTTSLIFYTAGLVVTMGVMHVFKAAQPALLYLSPAGILSVLLTALLRGELKEVFAFSTEAPPEEGGKAKADHDEEEEEEEEEESEESD